MTDFREGAFLPLPPPSVSSSKKYITNLYIRRTSPIYNLSTLRTSFMQYETEKLQHICIFVSKIFLLTFLYDFLRKKPFATEKECQ